MLFMGASSAFLFLANMDHFEKKKNQKGFEYAKKLKVYTKSIKDLAKKNPVLRS